MSVAIDLGEFAVVTPSEAARRLGVSSARVRQLTRQGKLDVVQTPLGRLILVGGDRGLDALARQREASRQA